MDKTKKDALQKTHKQLAKLIESFDNILEPLRMASVDSLQSGTGGALQTTSIGTSQILLVADTMQHTENVHGISINLDFIREQFADIFRALDTHDYPMIADTLEFELMPMLCEWFDELDAIFGDGELAF